MPVSGGRTVFVVCSGDEWLISVVADRVSESFVIQPHCPSLPIEASSFLVDAIQKAYAYLASARYETEPFSY